MKNPERQKMLDEQKWNESSSSKRDLSGAMDYCAYCQYLIAEPHRIDCKITHEQRVEKLACAKAYNRMKKESKK